VIVILDSQNQGKDKKTKKEEIWGGIFKKYAKPELIPFEKEIAWKNVSESKHWIKGLRNA